MAAYNAEKTLREVLDSFVGMRHMDNIEVIVIDDGGTDASLEIAKSYADRFPDVFIPVHKENGGWGSTVNYSIRNARGKYFKLLDGDDYYKTGHLDSFVEYLFSADADLIVTPYCTFRDGEELEPQIAENYDSSYIEGHIYALDKTEKPFPLAMHALAVKRDLLLSHDIRLKEHCVYRDMEFTANIILYADSICFFSKPIYYYRLGRDGQSISIPQYLKHMDEHADIVYDILSKTLDIRNGRKIQLLYELAEGAYVQQFKIYYYAKPDRETYRKLKEFNRHIKDKYPVFYEKAKLPMPYYLFQKMDFSFYYGVAAAADVRRKILRSLKN